MWRVDPLDYYRERGWNLTINTKLLNFTELDLHYNDVHQSSQGVVTDYAVFSPEDPQRPNPSIADGRLRSFSGTLSYDSRPLLRSAGQDYYFQMLLHTRISVSAEISDPRWVASDFDFRRYSFRIERRDRLLNWGLTTITVAGGIATGAVPAQREFIVDFGMKAPLGVDAGLLPPSFQRGGFNTLNRVNFGGTRALLLTVRHDFDRLLFAKSGIPFIRSLPFTLNVHAGAFWTDFANHPATLPDSSLLEARTPYAEVGFGLGNLTPFLSPLNCAARFTWQLSSYPTRGFSFFVTLRAP